MIIQRKPPRYPRRGPSCLFSLFIFFGIAVSFFVIQNVEQVREVILPTPTPEPTRSATEYALLAELSKLDAEYAEAVDYYEQAIALDGAKAEFYIRLIDLLIRQNQAEKAVEKAEQATILAPDNDRVWVSAAAAYVANGNRLSDKGDVTGANLQYASGYSAATRGIALNPENADAYAYAAAGLVLQQLPDLYAQGEELADTAILLNPENPLARYYMAIAFTLQGFYKAALEQYQLGIDSALRKPANEEWPVGFNQASLYIGQAYNYYAEGRLPDAILSFDDALNVDPLNAGAYDGKAHMYIQLGDAPLAEENALESVRLNPNVARAQGRLGEAYFRSNNYLSAIPPLEKAIELYGSATDLNARFFNMLANAYVRNDLADCDQARPLFEEVLRKTVNPLLVESAQAGLEECRRATLQQTP